METRHSNASMKHAAMVLDLPRLRRALDLPHGSILMSAAMAPPVNSLAEACCSSPKLYSDHVVEVIVDVVRCDKE